MQPSTPKNEREVVQEEDEDDIASSPNVGLVGRQFLETGSINCFARGREVDASANIGSVVFEDTKAITL